MSSKVSTCTDLEIWRRLTHFNIEYEEPLISGSNDSGSIHSRYFTLRDLNSKRGMTSGFRIPESLSEEKFKETLKIFISLMNVSEISWPNHIYTLIQLESSFRKSSMYTLQKASDIFQEYIAQIYIFQEFNEQKPESIFDINGYYNVVDNCYWSYLGFAATNSSPALLSGLISSGANVNTGEFFRGKDSLSSPIDLIVRYCTNEESPLLEQCINILVRNGCNTKFNRDGYIPPLVMAAIRNKPNLVKYLVGAKADIDLQNPGFEFIDCRYTEPNIRLSKPKNLLEVAIYSDTSFKTFAYQILLKEGIDLFATNIIKEILQNSNPYCKSMRWSKETFPVLSQTSFTFINHVKQTLKQKIPIPDIINIVTEYLNFPK